MLKQAVGFLHFGLIEFHRFDDVHTMVIKPLLLQTNQSYTHYRQYTTYTYIHDLFIYDYIDQSYSSTEDIVIHNWSTIVPQHTILWIRSMVDDPLWDGSTSSRISRNLLILLAFLKYVHTNKHENTTHMRTMVQWCWNIYNYIYHKKMTQIYVKSSSTMEHRFIKPCHVENLRCCHRPSLEPLPLATW